MSDSVYMAWVPIAVGDEAEKEPEHGDEVAGPRATGATKRFEAEERVLAILCFR